MIHLKQHHNFFTTHAEFNGEPFKYGMLKFYLELEIFIIT